MSYLPLYNLFSPICAWTIKSHVWKIYSLMFGIFVHDRGLLTPSTIVPIVYYGTVQFISSAWSSGSHSIQSLLYYYYYYYYYIFQIFSSNLSKPMSRGGINWSLCGSNSLGTSHSTQGRDDSSSSSTTGLHCIYCILVYIGVMSVCTSR